jgi:hypothetical protein
MNATVTIPQTVVLSRGKNRRATEAQRLRRDFSAPALRCKASTSCFSSKKFYKKCEGLFLPFALRRNRTAPRRAASGIRAIDSSRRLPTQSRLYDFFKDHFAAEKSQAKIKRLDEKIREPFQIEYLSRAQVSILLFTFFLAIASCISFTLV